MSVLDNYRKHHLPSKEVAKVHVGLVIKEYRRLDEYKFKRQLEVTERGLYVAGFSLDESQEIVKECLEESGL
ncbi:hypothetical protein [Bacillus anthracis]